MAVSKDLLDAAQEFGLALSASSVVKDYFQLRESVQNDLQLKQQRVAVEQFYQELIDRQQNGEVLSPYSIREFNQLRDRYTSHPMIVQLVQCEETVKALFSEAGSVVSSVLCMDYTQLVLD